MLTHGDSQRALALDSVMFVTEPFAITNIHNFSADQRTRIILFVVNAWSGVRVRLFSDRNSGGSFAKLSHSLLSLWLRAEFRLAQTGRREVAGPR